MRKKIYCYICCINLTKKDVSILVDEKIFINELLKGQINSYKRVSSSYHQISVMAQDEQICDKKLNLRPNASYILIISEKAKQEDEFKCVCIEEKNILLKETDCAIRIANFAKEIKDIQLEVKDAESRHIKTTYTNISPYHIINPTNVDKLKIIDNQAKETRLKLPKLKKYRIYTIFLVHDKVFKIILNIDKTSYSGNNIQPAENIQKLPKPKFKIKNKKSVDTKQE
ncbi:MAG: hypothetical protein BEN19_08150 [Epulopiscium sp. Nuni2H_MBin003]|nr:MAG: hypothetical protein BEN19_08150 [Epulopiscium sp. Nuni2H_MBin003]